MHLSALFVHCDCLMTPVYCRPPPKMARVKAIVDESSMFSVVTPSVAQLTEALKSAENWTVNVVTLLVCDYTSSVHS